MKPIIALLFAASAFAQVPIGTGSGSGGGGGSSTASAIRSGLLAAIPATCAVADVYYATDATITTGLSKFYVCTATNTWTQTGAQGNADGSITITSSASGLIDIQVTSGVFATLAGTNTFTGTTTFAGSTNTIPQQVIATDPSTCTVGQKYTDTTTSPAVDYSCLTTNVWTAMSNGSIINTSGSGYIWPFGAPWSQANSPTFGAATVYLYEFVLPNSIALKKIIAHSSTSGSGQYATMGVYSAAGDLLAQTDVINVAAVGSSATTFTFASSLSLTAGTSYFFAICASGTAAWQIFQGSETVSTTIINAESTKRRFSGSNAATSPGASMALPPTMGATRTALNFTYSQPSVLFVP